MDVGLLATIFNFTSWVPNIRESKFGEILGKLYEPFLEPFRKIIPPIGMIDISSLVALFVLVLFQAGLRSIFNMIIVHLM